MSESIDRKRVKLIHSTVSELITEYRHYADALRADGDAELAACFSGDADDFARIAAAIDAVEIDSDFFAIDETINDLDTAPREDVRGRIAAALSPVGRS